MNILTSLSNPIYSHIADRLAYATNSYQLNQYDKLYHLFLNYPDSIVA
ncbi:hypothetical protein M1D47_22895 [Bacillus sp. R1-10]